MGKKEYPQEIHTIKMTPVHTLEPTSILFYARTVSKKVLIL